MEPDTKPNWCSANFAYNWDAWLNYTYPLRWFGGAGGGPPTAQGLQHRLCGLHQRRGGGWRGAPPGGGRLEQPPNTTVSGCQITGETKNEKIIKKSIPLAHCLHSTHVSCCNYFLFLYTFHCFLYEKKINMLFSFFFSFYKLLLGLFFFSPAPSTQIISFFLCLLSSASSVEKAGTFSRKKKEKKYKKYPCQSCCLRTNASFKEKTKETAATSKPASFFLANDLNSGGLR